MVEELQPRRGELLRNVPYFQHFSPEALNQINQITQEKSFSRGELIFGRGDPGDAMYIIDKGLVEISGSRLPIMSILGSGEFFGEMSLLSNLPRQASATALDQDTKLLVLPKEGFERVIASNLHFMRAFVNKMGEELVRTSEMIAYSEVDEIAEVMLLVEAIDKAGLEAVEKTDDQGKRYYNLEPKKEPQA